MDKVNFSRVEKVLSKIPGHIRTKLLSWAEAVEVEGLMNVRKLPGFHDEPLKGKRFGQRSIRLSRGYRAIYTQKINGKSSEVVIEEVSKHEY